MKKYFFCGAIYLFSFSAQASDIPTAGHYFGPIQGVASGFFGHAGVGLPSGQSCHGSNIVVLQTSNAKYKEILSTLLIAEATKQPVKIYQLGAQTFSFPGAFPYCIINEASLGDFPAW